VKLVSQLENEHCRRPFLRATAPASDPVTIITSSPLRADQATPAGLHALSAASRDLLRRTAELPESEQGLLAVLAEYRHAVYAFVAAADGMCT
jgi:hypothetical protein